MSQRTFIARSPLGDQLEFRSLMGQEHISRLFEFRVRLISKQPDIAAKSLLGKDMSIEMDLTTEIHGSGKRFLSGQVTQFTYTGRDGTFSSYEAVLRPWLWHATRRSDFRIFQNKTVPEIVQEVLEPYGFVTELRLVGKYRRHGYLVQYGESDFNFVSRLMEKEGIFYLFAHQLGRHTLLLGDDIGSVSFLPHGPRTIPYYSSDRAGQVKDEDHVDMFGAFEDIASGRFAADDYDFEQPRAMLGTGDEFPAGHREDDREIFDWPGGYTDRRHGEEYARIRLEQLQVQRESVRGEGNARCMAPGHLFTLCKYPRQDLNKDYLIETATYRFEENARTSDGAGGSGLAGRGGTDSATTYRIGFHAVPKRVAYRSQRSTPKPHTTGPQTAVVTGPAGEEIHTDKYGRVKVQFHWDRYGKRDENSSCWIRVSQNWAGAGYGSMHIPRIGQEVIVDFLNGDPDHPIITGRVYNAMAMPPWELPANKTQSGIKTRSSQGGVPGDGMKNSPGTANALRFEDKAGAEQLWLHAQKDMLAEVECDSETWIGRDRSKVVDRDEFNTIHRDRTEVVDRNEKIDVHGWRTEVVDLDETLTVHQNRRRTVDLDESLHIRQSRHKTVGQHEKDSIGRNWSTMVGRYKSETIGIACLQNVGIARVVNIGAAYSVNVGMLMNTLVGMNQSSQIGRDQSFKVGNDHHLDVGRNSRLSAGDTFQADIGKSWKVHVGQYSQHAAGTVLIRTAGEHLELACGAARIVLRADGGIYLYGTHIEMLAASGIHVDAAQVKVNCGAAQAAPEAPPPPAPAEPDPAVPGLDDAMEGLAQAASSLKGALGAVQQIKGLVQTAKAIGGGDTGALTGAMAGALGGALGRPLGSALAPSAAPPGSTPGFNPNA
ncbi:Uncharacterized protein conserved in bacteria [Delftia tsuruhatensis]|uniref:type VI secretion system Vgr family protein n=1 Tax=Delftia tsuruhatensis TaxID=180282 RepID=UPI001E6AF56E|nr:type VI secretion system tip protein TssI/VgrG [Delftia tsuruhatensis]CAB5663601.1 Uncharacterized protein conserved in bacteria [Delftia tsuruhatensis]CAC9677334.1 Uncharacterized protein conserved in bacteria [Delftia tsuruhatensis]